VQQLDSSFVGSIALDRYLIEQQLGEGAMGVVYRGRHIKVGRTVAIKVLHDHLVQNDEMVERFDSLIFRARRGLPPTAQYEIDRIGIEIDSLKETLARVPQLDPTAQDARRLMSHHLPGLIDRYLNVPKAYRGETDGEGKTVDQRLVEALAAGRQALGDISENLAKQDLLAFETQGRFIQSRYQEKTLD